MKSIALHIPHIKTKTMNFALFGVTKISAPFPDNFPEFCLSIFSSKLFLNVSGQFTIPVFPESWPGNFISSQFRTVLPGNFLGPNFLKILPADFAPVCASVCTIQWVLLYNLCSPANLPVTAGHVSLVELFRVRIPFGMTRLCSGHTGS